jgi:hypothetical protein
MTTKTTEELLEEAEKVSSVIATARRLIADGKTVDLSNMEGKIGSLCENAEAAQSEQTEDVQNALAAIVEDLNLLNEEMSAKMWDGAEASLEDTAKRAIDAYSQEDGER